MRRAEAAGVTALVLTIDKPINGIVWDMARGLVKLPHHLMIANLSVSVEDWIRGVSTDELS